MKYVFIPALLLIAGFCQPFAAADEFSFDVSEFEKKAVEFEGHLEARYEHYSLDQSAALYRQSYYNKPNYRYLDRKLGLAELTGRLRQDDFLLEFTGHAEAEDDQQASEQESGLYEAFVAYRSGPELTMELGKRSFKWGKAYAWNLLGFVERAKDPNEPDLAREGYTVLAADYIYSGSGALQTLAFTPVYLPVREDLNTDYGAAGHDNVAAKLYLLYHNIDIDLAYLSNGSQDDRLGMDFAANLSTNFELHGEWSYIKGYSKSVTDSSGNIHSEQDDVHNYLLGLRYLTENETTFIIEYYRNGTGYNKTQMRDYYGLIEHAIATDNSSLLQQARRLGQEGYTLRNPGRQYLFARISNKEPFDILYFTPAITTIVNLDDNSYSLSPELLYTGVTNLELRFKATLLNGDRYSEFGEKPNDAKYELRLRYYF